MTGKATCRVFFRAEFGAIFEIAAKVVFAMLFQFIPLLIIVTLLCKGNLLYFRGVIVC
jgi:hypothetical protein